MWRELAQWWIRCCAGARKSAWMVIRPRAWLTVSHSWDASQPCTKHYFLPTIWGQGRMYNYTCRCHTRVCRQEEESCLKCADPGGRAVAWPDRNERQWLTNWLHGQIEMRGCGLLTTCWQSSSKSSQPAHGYIWACPWEVRTDTTTVMPWLCTVGKVWVSRPGTQCGKNSSKKTSHFKCSNGYSFGVAGLHSEDVRQKELQEGR